MGQTLTHGVYLPDEGERNCYAGLASNWQILNTAVGNIAEKAPLVHTHTVSQITDFPAYGTTAGTICEGNDSRLSDARTPVAHTHTKSDVTDLLNSNFIPSANNSYDLGSSSYQWNNLYAKNYFYNGTQWGLDQANVWTSEQTYKTGSYGQMIWLQDSDLDLSVNGNTGLTDTYQHMIHWCDKNKTSYSTIQSWTHSTENTLVLRSKYRTDASTVRDLSVRFTSTATNKVIYPETNGDVDLGTSTNKWKSLNGINPGALSLPRGYTEEGADKHYINIASVIQTLDGTLYNYTMPDNGWICIRAEQAQQVHVAISTWYFGQSVSHPTGTTLIVSVPFRKNDQISLKVKAVTLQYARFYPMQGNV